jgi:hypothetical protein
MKYHLIIGFGKWSKKNLDYLKNKKKLKNIIIKTRDKFIYPDLKVLSEVDNNKIIKNIDTMHICTPVESHFKYLKKFKHLKKVIVEKPIVKKKTEFNLIKNIYKKRFFIVNYIDTFSPIINKAESFLKKNKFNKIVLNYSKKKNFYKKKYDFANEWLDHPLSLILLFFKKFGKLEIKKHKVNKKGKLYNQTIIIKYKYLKFEIIVNLNNSNNIQRNIQFFNNKNIYTFHFYKNSIYKNNLKIFQSKLNSFDIFYKMIKTNKKNPLQNFNTHEKIFLEKEKIIKKLKIDF